MLKSRRLDKKLDGWTLQNCSVFFLSDFASETKLKKTFML